MGTNKCFWSYLAQCFLWWEMFQTEVVEKIKTHILGSVTFFSEKRAVYETLWKNTLQTDRPQTAIWRMRIVRCIARATNTHSEYVILSVFYVNSGCTNANQCYVIRTLPVVFLLESVQNGSGAGGTWTCPLNSIQCRDKLWVELYLYSPYTPSWRGQGNFTF
jgi:hypothetical protein